jgi:hypothetical protein
MLFKLCGTNYTMHFIFPAHKHISLNPEHLTLLPIRTDGKALQVVACTIQLKTAAHAGLLNQCYD